MILLIVLCILAILVATQMNFKERMTNKDVISLMQTYGDQTEQKKKNEPVKSPIYGPSGVVAPVTETKKNKTKQQGQGDYPEIYGPDVPLVPGGKSKNSESNDVYDYNPDFQKAFPTSGPPQPFLNNFSAFQS